MYTIELRAASQRIVTMHSGEVSTRPTTTTVSHGSMRKLLKKSSMRSDSSAGVSAM
jgi:hypothetical protein